MLRRGKGKQFTARAAKRHSRQQAKMRAKRPTASDQTVRILPLGKVGLQRLADAMRELIAAGPVDQCDACGGAIMRCDGCGDELVYCAGCSELVHSSGCTGLVAPDVPDPIPPGTPIDWYCEACEAKAKLAELDCSSAPN